MGFLSRSLRAAATERTDDETVTQSTFASERDRKERERETRAAS